MTTTPKQAQRRSSPGNRSRSTQAPPKGKYDDELQVALEHQAQLNAEYAELVERRDQLNVELERVSKLANQVVGRIDTIQELRGEREPLLSVSEIQKRIEAAQKAQNGAPTTRPTRSRAKTKGARRRGGK